MKRLSGKYTGITNHESSSATPDPLSLALADRGPEGLDQFDASAGGQVAANVPAEADVASDNSSADSSFQSLDTVTIAASSGSAVFTDNPDTPLVTDGTSANQYSITRFTDSLSTSSGTVFGTDALNNFAHDGNLAGDEPSPAFVFSAASPGSQKGGTTDSGGTTAPVTDTTSAGLHVNVTYDASVNNAPAGFKIVVDQVVQYFESHFSDPVTININVGFGEVGGSLLSAGALGSSLTYLTSLSYSQIISGLVADAKGTTDASAVASLPATNPNGGTYWVTTAEGKALGLIGASSNPDGYVGFNSSANIFDYNNSDGVTAGQYDFFGVVAHELTEVMGRILLVGGTIGSSAHSYVPYDLFHYSAPGVHDYSGSTAGYFSVDNGATSLNTFNTVAGGDYGDWAGATPDAGNAFASPGKVLPISSADLIAMDAIGWDAASTSTSPPPSLADLTVSDLAFSISPAGSSLSFHINNAGADTAAASTAGIYLSSDNTITTADTLVGSYSTPSLAAGAADLETLSLSLPAQTVAGTYYLGVIADSNSAVTESSETNNTAALPVILGTNGNNALTGTASSDTMLGFDGNDTLYGGAGIDTLVGGTGNDHFIFKATTDGGGTGDLIVDFAPGADVLDFSSSAFGRHLADKANTGTLAASHFVSGASESSFSASGPGFWFNTNNYTLYYDSNGNSAGGQIALAQLENGVAITNSNIHLV